MPLGQTSLAVTNRSLQPWFSLREEPTWATGLTVLRSRL